MQSSGMFGLFYLDDLATSSQKMKTNGKEGSEKYYLNTRKGGMRKHFLN
jgi:hypothetical protein